MEDRPRSTAIDDRAIGGASQHDRRGNLAAWGANSARVAEALQARYELDDDAVAFFTFFAEPPPDSTQPLLAVLDDALASGDDPVRARRAARLLQAYELLFWDTLAEGIA